MMIGLRTRILIHVTLLSVCLATLSLTFSIPLSEFNWTVTNGHNVTVAGTIPGDVYSALSSAGVVGDVLFGFNDVELRWVAFESWDYVGVANSTLFTEACTPALGYGASVFLDIASLQTFASITINGVLVARSYSQFIPLRVEITEPLCTSLTDLVVVRIAFNSTARTAETLGAEWISNHSTWIPLAPAYIGGLPFRNFVRSDQSSFGWDWGPALVPVAVWGPAEIRLVDPCRPQTIAPRLTVTQRRGDRDVFTVRYSAAVSMGSRCSARTLSAHMSVIDARAHVVVAVARVIGNTTYHLELDCDVQNPVRWWPRGLGPAALHRWTLNLVVSDNDISVARHDEEQWIGFREVALRTVGDPLAYGCNASGSSWCLPGVTFLGNDTLAERRRSLYFEVNNIPVYAKGVNLIPPDALAGRLDSTNSHQRLVDAMISGNMNMVRVWGGGRYLPSEFYASCDEAGIMVWQEMMFACAEYPDENSFLELVRNEVSVQVQRLVHHPSIVLWSGNNEDSVFDQGPASPYQRLNTDVVLRTIADEDSTRPLWPSSPSCGFVSGVDDAGHPNGEPIITRATCTASFDTHFYDYTSCPNTRGYPVSPFVSEYGFEALPRLADWLPDMPEPARDASIASEFVRHRQRHANGSAEILLLIDDNFLPPSSTLSSVSFGALFDRITYLSQLMQAVCVSSEALAFRRGRNEPQRTMGSLFWQLNQVWTSPSWAAVEYTGRTRPLHSAIAQAYEPLTLQLFFVNDTFIRGHVSNDFATEVVLHLLLELLPANRLAAGSVSLARWVLRLPPSGGAWTPLVELSINNRSLARLRSISDSSDLTYSVTSPYVLPMARRLKHLLLDAPVACMVHIHSTALGYACGFVTCNSTALFVTLQSSRFGWFIPNGFHAIADERVAVTYQEPEAAPTAVWARQRWGELPQLTPAVLERSITVETLNSDYIT